ncbi:hypothetical protein KI387_007699, partial [Taxus chinensis]
RKKVRVGHESADLPKDSPFRVVQRYLSQVFRESWDKSTRWTCGTRKGEKDANREQGSPNRPKQEDSSGTVRDK